MDGPRGTASCRAQAFGLGWRAELHARPAGAGVRWRVSAAAQATSLLAEWRDDEAEPAPTVRLELLAGVRDGGCWMRYAPGPTPCLTWCAALREAGRGARPERLRGRLSRTARRPGAGVGVVGGAAEACG
ncbi:MAG: hypothetical protein U1F43_34765 [Myxococcota bacterium]